MYASAFANVATTETVPSSPTRHLAQIGFLASPRSAKTLSFYSALGRRSRRCRGRLFPASVVDGRQKHALVCVRSFDCHIVKASFADSDPFDRGDVGNAMIPSSPPRHSERARSTSGRIILRAEHLTREVEGRRLVDDVSFSVEHGDVVAIIGPSGSGKSSLLRLLNQSREQAIPCSATRAATTQRSG